MSLKVRLNEIQREEEQIQEVRDLLRIRYERAHLHTNENADSRCVYCQKKLKANWDALAPTIHSETLIPNHQRRVAGRMRGIMVRFLACVRNQ